MPLQNMSNYLIKVGGRVSLPRLTRKGVFLERVYLSKIRRQAFNPTYGVLALHIYIIKPTINFIGVRFGNLTSDILYNFGISLNNSKI